MLDNMNPVSPEEISEEKKQEIINKIVDGIVKRRMTAPAIMFLESIKPINYIGSQLMIFLEPIILSIFNISQYREIALMLEDRDTIERILMGLENASNNKDKKEKTDKSEKKQLKED